MKTINESHTVKSGCKRLRHGSYKVAYLCSKGRCKRKAWRAEYQAITPGGAIRLRKWFNSQARAREWLNGY